MKILLSYGVWVAILPTPKIEKNKREKIKEDVYKASNIKEENVIIYDIFN